MTIRTAAVLALLSAQAAALIVLAIGPTDFTCPDGASCVATWSFFEAHRSEIARTIGRIGTPELFGWTFLAVFAVGLVVTSIVQWLLRRFDRTTRAPAPGVRAS